LIYCEAKKAGGAEASLNSS